MSYTSPSKVVRTVSLLDESNIYFSHVFSETTLNQQVGGRKVYEDIDVEAEKFIKKRHQKFELSKWIAK